MEIIKIIQLSVKKTKKQTRKQNKINKKKMGHPS